MTAIAASSHHAAALIDVEGVSRSFGDTTALVDVDMSVPAGTVQGLLGPNGAGKTTLVRILATLLAPDAGSARIGGVDVRHDPNTVRSLIGLAGQFAAVDEVLTGRENLVMVGQLYRLGTTVSSAGSMRSITCSRAMRRRRGYVRFTSLRPCLVSAASFNSATALTSGPLVGADREGPQVPWPLLPAASG